MPLTPGRSPKGRGRTAAEHARLASIFGRHEFAIRRLHSLTGIIPVGAFLVVHFVTNVSILDGPATFQERVEQIHNIGPVTLLLVEWLFIFLPILFHGLIGLMIVTRGKRNILSYPYRENVRYALERWTGVVTFAFILWHVFHTRGWFTSAWWMEHVTLPLGGGTFDFAARRRHRRGVDSSVRPGGRRLSRRRPGRRLPPFQRRLDGRHHLGRVDE